MVHAIIDRIRELENDPIEFDACKHRIDMEMIFLNVAKSTPDFGFIVYFDSKHNDHTSFNSVGNQRNYCSVFCQKGIKADKLIVQNVTVAKRNFIGVEVVISDSTIRCKLDKIGVISISNFFISGMLVNYRNEIRNGQIMWSKISEDCINKELNNSQLKK